MAVPAPASLRDLYITPSNTWSFVPPSLSHDSSNSTHPPVSGPSTSSQWSTRTAPNPLFDLSSTLSGDDSGLDITSLAKEFLAAALLQYATSALVQPWEVGRTLLQVQWVPRDPSDIAPDTGTDIVEDDGEVRHCTPRDRGHCCSSRELRSSFGSHSAQRLVLKRERLLLCGPHCRQAAAATPSCRRRRVHHTSVLAGRGHPARICNTGWQCGRYLGHDQTRRAIQVGGLAGVVERCVTSSSNETTRA